MGLPSSLAALTLDRSLYTAILATLVRPPARPTARIRRAITTPVQRTVTNPNKETPRNAPCPCASGKKYKKCCAR